MCCVNPLFLQHRCLQSQVSSHSLGITFFYSPSPLTSKMAKSTNEYTLEVLVYSNWLLWFRCIIYIYYVLIISSKSYLYLSLTVNIDNWACMSILYFTVLEFSIWVIIWSFLTWSTQFDQVNSKVRDEFWPLIADDDYLWSISVH